MNLDEVIDYCKEHNLPYLIEGDNPQVLIYGEITPDGKHRRQDYIHEEALIDIIKPKKILHEGAYDNSLYKNSIKHILDWREKYGIPVELCDIPQDMSFKSEKNLMDKLGFFVDKFRKEAPSDFAHLEYETLIRMMSPLREMEMASIIVNNVESYQPLFVGLGGGHILPTALLHKYLTLSDVSYVAVLQQSPQDRLPQFENYHVPDK